MEEILAAAGLALTIYEKLEPKIEEMVQKGDITIDQQLALHDRVDALRNRRRWKPTPGEPSSSTAGGPLPETPAPVTPTPTAN